MAGTQVNLPAVGPVSRRALLLGGGAAALVMGVIWWRIRKTTPAAPAADTSGLDAAALDDSSGIAGGGGGGGGGSTSSSSTSPTSNPQWTAAAMQALSGVADPAALAAALGLYLTGGAVTTDQELLIDQAIAAAGYPPVAGPNGYPPAIRTQPSGGQTAGQPKYVAVREGTWVSEFLAEHPELGLTVEQLSALNPGIILKASAKGYDPNGDVDVINSAHSGGKVRVA